jgi:hypothetical protein
MKLIAIDPWDCGCTECITGEYKPLRFASDDDIADLLAGRLRDNTYPGTLQVSVSYRTERDRNYRMVLAVEAVTVTLNPDYGELTHEKTWNPDPYRAGLMEV